MKWPASALIVGTVATAIAPSPVMFRADARHGGIYDAAGVAELHGVKWTFRTGGAVISTPAVADGTLYIGSWDSYFYALDAASGRQRWRFKTGEDPNINNQVGIQSSAVVADGVVYFGCRDSHLYALDAASGAKRWAFSTADS